jgi:hypothetical protein
MEILDEIRIGKNHRICFNCEKKDCKYKWNSNKCEKLDNKKRGLMDKWI